MTEGAIAVGVAAMLSLAVAMGVGRFAFTPLYPLMLQDGLLNDEGGALLAASNYLGYLVGALVAARVAARSATLMVLALIGTVMMTAAMGWTAALPAWAALRFGAGVLSAWALVATSAWALGWLASLRRPQHAGTVFAGVGLGIAAAGMFCWVAAKPGVGSMELWVGLATLTGIAIIAPLIVVSRLPAPAEPVTTATAAGQSDPAAYHSTRGLIFCYTLYGLGYILPATYLPAMARNLVADPQIFGLAWPLFGAAAVLSTVFAAWALKHTNRLKVWSVGHLLMALGVLLPLAWPSLAGISIAALLVGGTFMVITMVAMQEARAVSPDNATPLLGKMTAGFALGQLLGPLVPAAISRFTVDFFSALSIAMVLAAAGLLISSFYLWRQAAHRYL